MAAKRRRVGIPFRSADQEGGRQGRQQASPGVDGGAAPLNIRLGREDGPQDAVRGAVLAPVMTAAADAARSREEIEQNHDALSFVRPPPT